MRYQCNVNHKGKSIFMYRIILIRKKPGDLKHRGRNSSIMNSPYNRTSGSPHKR